MVSATDRVDLGIEPVDWQSEIVTAADDLRVVHRSTGVEGQDLSLEGGKHLRCSGAQKFLPVTLGQARDAVENRRRA